MAHKSGVAPSANKFNATFAAPPSRSSFLSNSMIGTGASGLTRVTFPRR